MSYVLLGEEFMRAMAFFLTLAALDLLAAPTEAVDLSKIERSIRKEPVYQSPNPQYCLLVFGPEAKTRVWLVLDGDVLYLDRNGDGDLTEPGKRIEPYDTLHNPPEQPDIKMMCRFNLRRLIKDGHPEGEPILSCVPDVHWFNVEHFIPADEREDALAKFFRKAPFRVAVGTMRYGEDSSLAFASRPGDAPILHFDGPRQLALHPYSQPLRRGETSWLEVQLLTPGLGATVRTHWAEGIKDIHPIAEIECPPLRPGAEPIRFRLELPGRG
jgi:hypothetical protein